MRALLHRLGWHGRNWSVGWSMGNLVAECSVCGQRRLVPFEDYADRP